MLHKKYLDEIRTYIVTCVKIVTILHDQQYSCVLLIGLILDNDEDS